MTEDDRSTAVPTAIQQYEIRVKGPLGPRWTAWFGGLSPVVDPTNHKR